MIFNIGDEVRCPYGIGKVVARFWFDEYETLELNWEEALR